MRYFKVAAVAFLAVVVLAVAPSAQQDQQDTQDQQNQQNQQDQQRKFVITDSTTNDPSMSTPTRGEPVPCSRDELYIAVKCSGDPDTSYRAVGDSSLDLTCSSDDAGIEWRDNLDHEYTDSVSWQCALRSIQLLGDTKAKRSWQEVTITGTLSLCTDNSISVQTSCGSSSD